MLAKRLRRQGMVISSSALVALFAQDTASATVPTSVVSSTIKAVALAPAGQAVASGTVSLQATALAEGVLKTMLLTKLKIVSALLIAIVTVGSAAGLCYKARATQRTIVERVDNAAAAPATKAEDPRSKAYNALLLEVFEDEAAGKTGKRLR
jgi:RNA polymerase sigma-70 factor (ECF subfamily)